MLPKIEAAITYISKNPGAKTIITDLEHAVDALKGRAGTVITE